MVLVNTPGNATPYALLEHSAWHGWTPADMVFPFFVFILGAAVPFSLSKRLERGASRRELLATALRRTAFLFCLGLIMNAWPFSADRLAHLRIPGVLQRLALCYGATVALFLYLRAAGLAALAAAGLAGYWLALRHIAAPGFSAGDLSRAGNLPAWLDRRLMAGHLWEPDYDPEGLLSTVPAVSQSLLGALTGAWLGSRDARRNKTAALAAAGVLLALAGLSWGLCFPINKSLWTSSFVLFTSGLALLALAALHRTLDESAWGAPWLRPFEALGVSALAAYVLPILGVRLMHLWRLPRPDGGAGNLRTWLTDHLFSPWLSQPAASLGFSLSYAVLWMFLFLALYRRKIVVKI